MAYTSVIPVHRLDRSIEYVKDKEKTTQKADSLEAAIDYAMNRTKTEQAVFEDTIGCTNENAYADMVATKKRFHKMGGVEGYHLVQSFAEGEVTPELAHLIGQELADRLLKGQYEVVITTHLNTRHYHNHIRSYVGVCLEGAIIALACIIFSAYAASPPAVGDTELSAVTIVWNYVGELVFNLLVLVGAIKASDRIVREMMGLGG